LRAEAAGNSHTDLVHSRKSSRLIVLRRPSALRENVSLEKTNTYSWTSRSTGLAAERHEPQAVELLALEPLSQITSPRI